MNPFEENSVKMHADCQGKIEVHPKVALNSLEDLSLAYTPGVAGPCMEIHKNPTASYRLTGRANTVAVVTDGSAVLGLGNIGPLAAMPVMEGKALLFKVCAGIDAWPICLDTQDTDEIVETIRRLAPSFGAVNLEDIAAPRCFEIEERLQDLEIPVLHDDQHGTAVATLAAVINACQVVGKRMEDLRLVISGAGAAGFAIAKFFAEYRHPPKHLVVCDSRGAISSKRLDLNPTKAELLAFTNGDDQKGTLIQVLEGADAFIGVSQGAILGKEDIARMAPKAIVLAMANPIPEVTPADALAAGALVVGTGRSDLPNQVNNVLAFPGIFRGALDARVSRITRPMLYAAAEAIAGMVSSPTAESVLPTPSWSPLIASTVAKAVSEAASIGAQD